MTFVIGSFFSDAPTAHVPVGVPASIRRSRASESITQRRAGLVVGESRQRAAAIARAVNGGESFDFCQPPAVSEERVYIRIRRPAFAIPHFHGDASLSGHPSAHQDTTNIIEVHRLPSALRAWATIPWPPGVLPAVFAGRPRASFRTIA